MQFVIWGKVVDFLSDNAPRKEREENNIKQYKRVEKIWVVLLLKSCFPSLNCWQGTKVGVTEAFDQSSTSTPQQSLMDGTNRGVGRWSGGD
jgi:hypothetical protein